MKPAAVGKTRLQLSRPDRRAVIRAIALDTIAAAAGCGDVARVLVVTSDGPLRTALADWPGVEVVRDGDPMHGADIVSGAGAGAGAMPGAEGAAEPVLTAVGRLRAAIAGGLSAADSAQPRAVLLGDLPALKPAELSAAFGLAASHDRAFVPDADGIGTVLVTARGDVGLRPLFGADSAAAHRAAGFVELQLPAASGLRRDLDTATHLSILRRLGLGKHTAALVA